MRVNLRVNWFGPDGNLRRPTGNPHLMPDDWKEMLPKSSVVISEPPKAKPEPKKD